jgi:hypothetical protein
MELDSDMAMRGWVIRPAELNSAPIFVRGAIPTDGYCEFRNGFVYAETMEEAREYDAAHNYKG